MRRSITAVILLFCSLVCSAQVSESTIWYVDGYSEDKAKQYFDNDPYLDPIEGIWQSSDGYKYSIEKSVSNGQRVPDKYRIVILATGNNRWKNTEIKGFITPGSLNKVYSMKYYTKSNYSGALASENLLLTLENPILATFQRLNGAKEFLYKLYPKASDNPSSPLPPGDNAPIWSGSSIVIGERYLATNNHVVDGARSLVVTGIDGDLKKDYDVAVVCVDKINDLAVIKITDPNFPGFRTPKYGLSTDIADVGTDIFVLGYPKPDTMGDEVKLTTGVVSSKTGFEGKVNSYQVSAPIQGGNSGGPLFDGQGNLIGIIRSSHAETQNVSYAIKLINLKNLVESSNINVDFSQKNGIASLSLPDKVKHISPYVLMVKANTKLNSTPNFNNDGVPESGSGPQPIIGDSDPRREASRLLQSAKDKVAIKEYEQAFVDIEKSLSLVVSSEAHYYRAHIARMLKRYDIMDESYAYCLEKNYLPVYCHFYIACSYLDRKNYQQAVLESEKVLQINRKFIQAYILKGSCYSFMGNHDGAISAYEQALLYEGLSDATDSTWAEVYNNLAFEYLKQNQIKKAESNAKKALQLDRLNGNAWETCGEVYYQLKDWDKCIYHENIAILIGNQKRGHWLGEAYYYRGMAKKMLGYKGDCYKDLILSQDHGYSEATTALNGVTVTTEDYSKTMSHSTIVKNPIIKGKVRSSVAIQAVETSDEFTAVYMIYANYEYVSGGWYSFNRKGFLKERKTGAIRNLVATSNCAISPDKSSVRYNGTESFVLYFEPLSKDCIEFDLIEDDNSTWRFNGIMMKEGQESNITSLVKKLSSDETFDYDDEFERVLDVPDSILLRIGDERHVLVLIRGGEFDMGYDGPGSLDMKSEPVHRVKVSSFYMSKRALTNLEASTLMEKKLSFMQKPDDYYHVDRWKTANILANALGEGYSLPSRLPTEAEWEYAATKMDQNKIRPSVNERNWCLDYFDDYPYTKTILVNPRGPIEGRLHVFRQFDNKRGEVYRRYRNVNYDEPISIRVVIPASALR